METLNRAIDDAATFTDMLAKLKSPPPAQNSAAIVAWNAEIERKKAERRMRRERERAHQELKA